jgi:hypothetical protein
MTPNRPRGRPRSEEHSYTKRKFPPHKVYRRDDRGIVGVESLGPQGLASARGRRGLGLVRTMTTEKGGT